MVARSATRAFELPGQNQFASFANWAEDDNRLESPDLRPNSKLSSNLFLYNGAPQTSTNGDQPNDLNHVTEIIGTRSMPRVEVLPIVNHPAIIQNTPRGAIDAGVYTGRWSNRGTGPADGFSIGFDYWENVLLDPDNVALGNVVDDSIFNVTIRNTFRRDNKSITAIDNLAGAGVILTGAAPPVNLAPLFDKIYQVTVTTDGPPNINGTIDWTTTIGILTLTITGTRITIFPYTPQSEIKEELQWVTDIIRSADGTEQRHSLRVNPRQVVDYEFFITNQSDVNKIRNLMIDWTTRVFGVPIWWNEVSLAADVTATDTVINVRPGALDTADFREGGLAMIYQEADDGTITIDSLQLSQVDYSTASPESTQNQLTFATEIQNNYDASKATVVPIYSAILADGISVDSTRVGDAARHKAKFKVLNNQSSIVGVLPGDYPELENFEGRPTLIIDDKNFMSGEMFTEKFDQKGQLVDFNLGPFLQLTQELHARRTTPFNWVIEDEAFHWQMRALFYHLRGKWKSVWLPTWRQDFAVNANIGSGATQIDVENEGFFKYVGGNNAWAGLRLLQTDGTISYHRITGTAEVDDITERLTIAPGAPNAITVAEVERVDLMMQVRLTDDKVVIMHNWMDAESDEIDTTIEAHFITDMRS